ncbi:MAG: exo-alpha-sialidase [Opitutales bacterium]|jgi:sialidase-1|nr:exo-alpha-sialidase [Opitutales bacterium]
MKSVNIILICASVLSSVISPMTAEDQEPFYYEIRPLFENGKHLGKVYRFRNVGLIQCPSGDLLAFVEARFAVSDHSEKDVLMRRSTDRGITWGPYEEVWGHLEEDDAGWKDPAPVVDETTGRLFYFMNTNESEKRLFYMTSDDNGYTWSDPIRIPDSLLRPEWKRWRNNPGPGIQLKVGKHKHRMLIPGHIVTHEDRHFSVVWYSDDHGESWQVSETAVQGSDEVSIVELSDGRVLMNIRSHGELDPGLDPEYRNFMYSKNGGESWYGLETIRDLIWESGHGSITRMETQDRNRLFAFNPVVVKRRDLTCFVSYDEGKTWPFKRVIHEAGGYSSVVVMDNYDIALAHNHGHAGRDGIDFVRFNLSWLTDGREHVNESAQTLPKISANVAHRTIWREDFDLSDGVIHDDGATAWTTLGTGGTLGAAATSNGKIRALNTDGETVWQSEKIDIGKVNRISIAVDAIKIGNFGPSDSLSVYYKFGDNGEELIESLSFSSDPQEDFETYQVGQDDVDVSGYQQVQVVIRARVAGANKALYWDRVHVSAP